MKLFLHTTFIFILSINSCVKNKQSNTSTTRPEDYTTAKKADTTIQKVTTGVDSLPTQAVKSSSSIAEKYFELISATSEDWVAGIPSGGIGTEYYFKIKITTAKKISFDTAWVNKKSAFSIFISKEQQSITSHPPKYSNGEIITLRVSDLKNNSIPAIVAPVNYKGAALISYTVEGKKEYFVVQEIKKEKTINRQ